MTQVAAASEHVIFLLFNTAVKQLVMPINGIASVEQSFMTDKRSRLIYTRIVYYNYPVNGLKVQVQIFLERMYTECTKKPRRFQE